MQTDGEVEAPPPWVVNRAVRIGRQAVGDRQARPTLWRRVSATLLRDTRLQPHTAGARGLGSQPARLLYGAGGVEIDLEVEQGERPGHLRILGHVTAGDLDLVDAWAVADGPSGRAEADLDSLGQFMLDGLAPGSYVLEIGLVSALIEFGDVQLKTSDHAGT